ncbi:MAG: SRPBCC domain-containing protein [Richelia sp. RM2_1_2]|nr:SRPBCC domain-containing protein [Richelia sp. SM2_1_7]NJM17934.1 SRPBCC domain-containing protein [Richelia sp. SM1_7_0]NJN10274.1 SRPBCC domain-containing protein [Richelia sp. RM1_1_1]NJO28860.1 SRPBCC domain-containing protein [Richelia sp. SL_2_1]NJO60398.1 SRPBCC domain-containing protein [Richelia sp. RM2_1_2]
MFGLNKEVFYPHPPEKVWQVITNSRTLAKWLMENDFEPRVGCKFCFYSQSLPGIDTNIRCEVIEVDEPLRLVYTWQDCMMSQSSIVIWTLKAVEGGTQLRLQHRVRETALRSAKQSVYSQVQLGYIEASDSFILASYLNGGWEKKLFGLLSVLSEISSV